MKKKIYAILLFTLVFIIALATKSFGYFEIENFEINCYVQENGDLEVEENITYKTNESKNGVTRDIELKNENNNQNSATGFELESVKVDGIEYTKTYSGKNGDSGVYEYTKGSNTHSLKVYTPFNKVGKTVTYTYLLKNVVVKYQDTAELYWNFIGSKWDVDISNVDINITLPEEAKNGAIYVYGHGADDGTFTKTENYITLNAKNIDAYQAIDARILFSNAAVPYSNKNVNKSVLEKYIDEEEGITKEREEKEILFGLNINEIAIGLSIVIVLIGIIIYLKYAKKEKVEKQKYVREIPANLEPELLQTIYYGKVCKDAFWITFLNLVKLGVYRIEKATNEVGKETQKITYVKTIDGLEEHQKKVISIINSFMNGNSIDLVKLEAKFKKSSNTGYRVFHDQLMLRKEELFGKEKKIPIYARIILYVLMVILILLMAFTAVIIDKEPEMSLFIVMFFGITTLIYSVMFITIKDKITVSTIIFFAIHFGMFQMGNIGILASAGAQVLYIPYILLFIVIQLIERIEIHSKEERQIKEQIKGLRRFIKDYSMLEEKGIEHITLWEDYLIMAIALKLNKRTINYFYDYAKDNLNTNFGTALVSIGTYRMMSTSFTTAFNSYQKAYTASVSRGSSHSGSSGGFSGGRSSGGGGRRWRRRKLLLVKSDFNNTSKNDIIYLREFLKIIFLYKRSVPYVPISEHKGPSLLFGGKEKC